MGTREQSYVVDTANHIRVVQVQEAKPPPRSCKCVWKVGTGCVAARLCTNSRVLYAAHTPFPVSATKMEGLTDRISTTLSLRRMKGILNALAASESNVLASACVKTGTKCHVNTPNATWLDAPPAHPQGVLQTLLACLTRTTYLAAEALEHTGTTSAADPSCRGCASLSCHQVTEHATSLLCRALPAFERITTYPWCENTTQWWPTSSWNQLAAAQRCDAPTSRAASTDVALRRHQTQRRRPPA